MEATVRIVHLLAAGVWLRGTVALVFAGVPAIRTLQGEERGRAMRELGRRWRPWAWGSMAALVLSGLWLADEHGALNRTALLHTDFGRVVLVKSLLVAVLIAGALLHDFVLGPRLVAVGWTNFALTVAVPVLGGVLVSMLE